MRSVRAYVSSNVVERLTRPLREADGDEDEEYGVRAFDGSAGGQQQHVSAEGGRVMDMAAFMGSLGAGSSDAPAPAHGLGESSVPDASERSNAFTTPSHQHRSIGKNRPSSAPHSGRAASTGSKAAGNAGTGVEQTESKEERQLKFAQFMERQRQVTKRKEDHIKQVRTFRHTFV